MIQQRIKFYADTPRGEKNKFFCWECSILDAKESLKKFIKKGFRIRAAWHETKVNEKIIENLRYSEENFTEMYDEIIAENKKLSRKH